MVLDELVRNTHPGDNGVTEGINGESILGAGGKLMTIISRF